MGTYITYSDVIRTCGIGTTLMTSTLMESTITEVENYSERWLNCKFKPTEDIDILDGTGNVRLFVDHNPLLSVRSITSDGNAILPTEVYWTKESGKIEISTVSSTSVFISKRQSAIIKYVHGFVDYSSTQTTLSTATVAGTSVVMTVASNSGLAANDWVEIYGTDGFREAAKITGTGTGTITVDQLVLTHAAASLIKKLEIPSIVKRFLEIEASIACLCYVMGITYTFKSSYNLGELGVTKTGPFEHYRETLGKLLTERDKFIGNIDRMGILKPRFYITS